MANPQRRPGQNDKVFKTTPGAGRRINPKAKPKAKPTPKPAAKPTKPALSSTGVNKTNGRTAVPTGSKEYNDWRNAQIEANRQRLKGVGNPPDKPAPKPEPKPSPSPAPVRSPAIGAPVHARPQAFGAATQVSGGVLSGAPAPSAYAPQAGAAQRPNTPQPMSPQYGGNDEPGRMGQNENGYQMPAQPKPAGGPDANGIDMERRRAFLDAEDSLSGLKAVKELLNRRKLSISVEN